jgi:hypothetical protein
MHLNLFAKPKGRILGEATGTVPQGLHKTEFIKKFASLESRKFNLYI